jgi:hypothetical protein
MSIPTITPDPRLLLATPKAIASVPQLTNLHVSQNYFTRDLAGKFSVGSVWGSASGSAANNQFAIRYEALLESDGELAAPVGDAVFETVYAIGVILDISVETTTSEVRFDAFSVSAAVQLGMASAKYSTTIFPTDAKILAGLLPQDGVFDPDNYDKLIAGIAAVKLAIGKNPSLIPQPNFRPSRILPSVESDLGVAQCVTFAVQYLSRQKQVQTATNDATNNNLDATLVRLVYAAFWPDLQDNQDPPDDVVKKAASWIADNFN